MKPSKYIIPFLSAFIATSSLTFAKSEPTDVLYQESCSMFFTDMRWQHRILLVRVGDDVELKELTKYIDYTALELTERKLLVLGIDRKTVYPLNNALSCLPSLDEVQHRLNSNKAVLIGLDGGTKEQYDVIDPVRIFSDIDSMPMRRRERQDN
ncbi:DUF4174 domain-containing protein [Alteromonas genovensis]|uniref:DUF4174 domain-containing protein n=1 Tax=Alteromonas genovensis TaxID=471225 RepID=A0A6N9TN49_9ALTE|nr:DUF4174 domain-containing protein [Alteromonas genovensis]NDW17276.1 DUF4174 domain-containing protein [Alteromonas genovensis]